MHVCYFARGGAQYYEYGKIRSVWIFDVFVHA